MIERSSQPVTPTIRPDVRARTIPQSWAASKKQRRKDDVKRALDYMQISLGFSRKGLVVFLLPMLPNLLFLVLANPNALRAVTKDHLMLDFLEHGSQVAYAALLVLVVSRRAAPMLSGLAVAMAVLLLSYFGLWAAFFTIGATFPMLMSMAIVPTVYFLLAAVWLRNPPALVFIAVFGVAHAAITYLDYH